LRVCHCPRGFPAGYYWYGGRRKGPGHPPKWIKTLLEGATDDDSPEQVDDTVYATNDDSPDRADDTVSSDNEEELSTDECSPEVCPSDDDEDVADVKEPPALASETVPALPEDPPHATRKQYPLRSRKGGGAS